MAIHGWTPAMTSWTLDCSTKMAVAMAAPFVDPDSLMVKPSILTVDGGRLPLDLSEPMATRVARWLLISEQMHR